MWRGEKREERERNSLQGGKKEGKCMTRGYQKTAIEPPRPYRRQTPCCRLESAIRTLFSRLPSVKRNQFDCFCGGSARPKDENSGANQKQLFPKSKPSRVSLYPLFRPRLRLTQDVLNRGILQIGRIMVFLQDLFDFNTQSGARRFSLEAINSNF